MSIDLAIDQLCPHAVTDEALFLDADRQMIRPLRPISSATSVKVYLNHAIEVPPFGVAFPAKSSGTRKGPFTIMTGVTDVIELKVNDGAVQTVVLPALAQISPIRVAALLNRQFTGIVFSVMHDRLAFATQETGLSSSIFLKSTSTAASVFGFTTNREYRGQQLVPGWTLISDPNTLEDRPTRLIVFDDPLASDSDFVEVSYVTVREECRRCGGIGVKNDWRYASNGQTIVIRNESLLMQELQKIFYTIQGSNPFHTWYGTQLIDAIGKKLAPNGFTQNLIVSNLYQAFSRWQSIKRQQEENVPQFVSDEEFPFRLLSVNLETSTDDPTIIFITATIQNRSMKPIQLTRGLKIPQSLDQGTPGFRLIQ